MKIDGITREKMKADIKVICDHVFKYTKITELSIGDMFAIWSLTVANRKYDDENKNVIHISGERLLTRDANYEDYPCGCYDKTLQTALTAIFQELGIPLLTIKN